MPEKTERIEARIAPERAERIRFASSLKHTSVSAFVVDAASERAERVIAETSYTIAPDRYFDALSRALRAIEEVGGRLIVVDAIDDAAQRFYEHFGFETVPGLAPRLIMRSTAARESLMPPSS